MSIMELSSMAKELGLHGSNLYSVKCGREYKDIKTDMDALELYKYLDGKRVVHVYVEPNVAAILGAIGTSTDGMVGRSLRNHERSSSLASVGIVKNSSRLRQDKTDVGGPSTRTQEADNVDDEEFDSNVDKEGQGNLAVYKPNDVDMVDNIEGLDVNDEDTDECKSVDSSSDDVVVGRTKHKKPLF
ncbi:hypothetical protein Dimus_018335 [Dionaea muscipula]